MLPKFTEGSVVEFVVFDLPVFELLIELHTGF
jgi:hypothetical protein